MKVMSPVLCLEVLCEVFCKYEQVLSMLASSLELILTHSRLECAHYSLTIMVQEKHHFEKYFTQYGFPSLSNQYLNASNNSSVDVLC